MDELKFDLFDKAKRKVHDVDDKLAESLVREVEDAYRKAGLQGIENLLLEIRKKYVEGQDEA